MIIVTCCIYSLFLVMPLIESLEEKDKEIRALMKSKVSEIFEGADKIKVDHDTLLILRSRSPEMLWPGSKSRAGMRRSGLQNQSTGPWWKIGRRKDWLSSGRRGNWWINLDIRSCLQSRKTHRQAPWNHRGQQGIIRKVESATKMQRAGWQEERFNRL